METITIDAMETDFHPIDPQVLYNIKRINEMKQDRIDKEQAHWEDELQNDNGREFVWEAQEYSINNQS